MSLRRLFLQQAQAVSNDFIIEVDVVGSTFTIPTNGIYTYLYDVTTSDGQTILGNTGNLTITFPSIGVYDINISGTFPTIYFNNGGDKARLSDIKQWGDIAWADFNKSFFGCSGLTTVTATDAPDLSGVTNMVAAFRNDSDLARIDLSLWDISGITSFGNFMLNVIALDTDIYDATLISWSAQAPQINQAPNFGGSIYTLGGAAEAARDTLINTYGWNITDGGGI